jgi:hypothetical protein
MIEGGTREAGSGGNRARIRRRHPRKRIWNAGPWRTPYLLLHSGSQRDIRKKIEKYEENKMDLHVKLYFI